MDYLKSLTLPDRFSSLTESGIEFFDTAVSYSLYFPKNNPVQPALTAPFGADKTICFRCQY